ncbi:MAG: alpha/beta fold hydrolase [Acidimicrobiales bacterium]
MGSLVTSDGIRIHYQVSGVGSPPMLLVHGWCSQLNHWDAVTSHFAAGQRVVAVDRRGHGRSEVATAGYAATRQADDLAEVMAAEGIEDAVVVAHAGATPATLELAAGRPDLVAAVVIVDGRLGPRATLDAAGGGTDSGLGRLIESLRAPAGDETREALYRGFFRTAGPEADRVVADAGATPMAVAIADLQGLAVDTFALAARVEQPVLWVSAGEGHGAIPTEHFADVRMVPIDDCGHFPQVEAPRALNVAIEDFVAHLI